MNLPRLLGKIIIPSHFDIVNMITIKKPRWQGVTQQVKECFIFVCHLHYNITCALYNKSFEKEKIGK